MEAYRMGFIDRRLRWGTDEAPSLPSSSDGTCRPAAARPPIANNGQVARKPFGLPGSGSRSRYLPREAVLGFGRTVAQGSSAVFLSGIFSVADL